MRNDNREQGVITVIGELRGESLERLHTWVKLQPLQGDVCRYPNPSSEIPISGMTSQEVINLGNYLLPRSPLPQWDAAVLKFFAPGAKNEFTHYAPPIAEEVIGVVVGAMRIYIPYGAERIQFLLPDGAAIVFPGRLPIKVEPNEFPHYWLNFVYCDPATQSPGATGDREEAQWKR